MIETSSSGIILQFRVYNSRILNTIPTRCLACAPNIKYRKVEGSAVLRVTRKVESSFVDFPGPRAESEGVNDYQRPKSSVQRLAD
jgi:hypothetical protein